MTQPFNLCCDLGDLDASKRLNYVLGQVLGVKDFQQEQLYFLNKSRLHNRSLHGYGTVWGLDVQMAGSGDELEIQVSPGLAIDTRGREVIVDALQCARLNTWLAQAAGAETANWQTLQPLAADDPRVAVYVALCYRECKTDDQAILGDPCRVDSGENGAVQPTRIKDDFVLKLLPEAPYHIEERWVRAIGDLLGRLDIVAGADQLSQDEVDALLDRLFHLLDDPRAIAALEADIIIPEAQSRQVIREMFRYWVTNTRPALDLMPEVISTLLQKIQPDATADPLDEAALTAQTETLTGLIDDFLKSGDSGPIDALEPVVVAPESADRLREAVLTYWSTQPQSAQPAEDECLLLASVVFSLTAGGAVNEAEAIEVRNSQRPYLLHTRLLQEMLMQGGIRGPQGEQGPRGQRGPRGQAGPAGPGLDQLMIRPNDMLPLLVDGQPFATLTNAGKTAFGYPALAFTERGHVTFSALRPSSFPAGKMVEMSLRLYCSGGGSAIWCVRGHWVRAIGPVLSDVPFNEPDGWREVEPTGEQTLLVPLDTGAACVAESQIEMRLFAEGDAFHLAVSPPVVIPPPEFNADYLLVDLELMDGGGFPINLLMAELRWSVEG